jgi:16S rRNA (cytidine1402-2'-O)-methyltransferase
VVPGPSAVLAALVVSGLPSDRFCFEGFPPRKPAARARALAQLAGEPRTMVFFEAPHRVLATLDAMAVAFGPQRRCALGRELTKLHEQVLRGTLAEVRDRLAEQGTRGEFTLVVAGAPTGPAEAAEAVEPEVVAEVGRLVEAGASTRDAVDRVARRAGRPRRSVYQAVLEAREFASLRGQGTMDHDERRPGGQGQSQERDR